MDAADDMARFFFISNTYKQYQAEIGKTLCQIKYHPKAKLLQKMCKEKSVSILMRL